MTFDFHFLKNVPNLAVGPNHEGGADDSHDFLTVHVLFLQNAEGHGDLFVGVSQQGKGQSFFFGEFFLRCRLIGGDAKQLGARLLNLFI